MTYSKKDRKAIVKTGVKLQKNRFIAGSDGNISVKLSNNEILITPSGYRKGELEPDNLVVIDFEGNVLEGKNKPSSEFLMHTYIYQNRPDITACVHSHPPYATSFAVAGEELPDNILPEIVLFVGQIPLTDYAPPGTDAVPKSLSGFVNNCEAFLLKNHGLLTIGTNLDVAYNRHETVEHYAKILTLAKNHGNVNQIPDDDYKRLSSMRIKK
ncbi:MAG: class II aldolase/adducin family protein [Candidatus Zixiibacteriota bacterium]|nr:MAG: class II aldolase/adducin family protein [candidate division Zixibacteria bacterium]